MIFCSRWSRPKLTGVLCDSHALVDAEDARPPTTLPPPTYVHTHTLAVISPTLTMFQGTRYREQPYFIVPNYYGHEEVVTWGQHCHNYTATNKSYAFPNR